jgi:hypothetical protein
MKPRRNKAAAPASTSQKKKDEKGRFQIVKLEERIAPNKGGIPHTGNSQRCGCSS